jgi:2-polyprenyl-3-methyl-5-hydroxy-6-metoxy-1,4-benzoquinol methylase
MVEPVTAAGYYANARADIIDGLPRPLGRVLDVGCGEGNVGVTARRAGAERVVGVEVFPDAAARAAEVLDRVVTAPIEGALDELADERFDTVLCLDVLEHLADPGAVLRRLTGVAAAGARLMVSVPNARHLSLVWDLLVHGTFGYTDWGHRDRTHLRWFTRRDIVALVDAAGWAVRRVGHGELDRTAGLDRLTGGRVAEFTTLQWHVLAEAPGA